MTSVDRVPRAVDPLVVAVDGSAGGACADDPSDMPGVWPAVVPGRGLQALEGRLFVEKMRDTIGLYLAPAERALLCLDKKSQIQALGRTNRYC